VGEIALLELIGRFPDLALAEDASTLQWALGLTHRGLVALPVQLGNGANTCTICQ
jgi:hypothetical protein